jgi:hypothetical protein
MNTTSPASYFFAITASVLLMTSTIVRADIVTALPTEVGNCNNSMYANCDSSPDQAQLELAGTSGAQDGNWDDLSGGVANRPFVTRLSVLNGETETVLISGGTASTTLSNTPGAVGVVITPTNLCDSTETPGTSCYATPNRIQVTLAYRKQSGQIGYNFSFPNDGSLSTTTGNAVSLLTTDGASPVTINSNTTIDLTLSLNTLGTSLRWTWLNGVPSYWNLASLGSATATVRVKFKLATLPALLWSQLAGSSTCTAIPVSSCELDKSHSDWLAGSMILSLDDTLGVGMTGALFATDGAVIGSVETSSDRGTGLPLLNYGMASSHFDSTGVERSATLRAFIPDATLVQVLGIPSFADRNASPTNATDVIGVARTGSSASVSRTFEEWNTATNGADGLLMTVSGITFSAPQYKVKAKTGTPKVPSVALTNGSYRFTLSATTGLVAKTCRSLLQTCTVEVYRAASSKLSSTLARVTSKRATRTSQGFTASFSLPKTGSVKKNTRLILVVKNKSKRVLSSTPLVLSK